MTKTGPSKKVVDRSAASGRLKKAQTYHRSAEILLGSCEGVGDHDPIRSLVISAAIGYADAITIAFLGKVNRQDHNAVTKLLRAALGKELPDAQSNQLSRILKSKDEVQYGVSFGRLETARSALDDLDKFRDWAIEILKKRDVEA